VLACGLLGAVLSTAAALRAIRLAYFEQTVEESRGTGGRVIARWTAGPFVSAVLIVAYGFFASPIHNLAVQGAISLGLH
jgi:NADH:ubiquinone oxidoreductase subunit 2 (subunit N)